MKKIMNPVWYQEQEVHKFDTTKHTRLQKWRLGTALNLDVTLHLMMDHECKCLYRCE